MKPSIAAFDVWYAAPSVPLTSAETLETRTIEPRPRSSSEGSAARTRQNAPVTLTSSVRFQRSSSTSAAAPPNPSPAFATTTSSPPNSRSAVATASATCSASAVSPATARPSISAATASSGSARRPVTTTLAPSRANRRAVAAPMPVPPPLMIATRSRSRMRHSLPYRLNRRGDGPDGEHGTASARGPSRARGGLPPVRRHDVVRPEQPVHDGAAPRDPPSVQRAHHADLAHGHGSGRPQAAGRDRREHGRRLPLLPGARDRGREDARRRRGEDRGDLGLRTFATV